MSRIQQRLQRIRNAAHYSRDGIHAAYEETAIRDLLILHSPLTIFACFLEISLAAKMLLIFASGFSLIVEFLNTAIEAAVDHTSTEHHPLAKRAKDLGSAAQTLALTLVALLWLITIIGN